MVNLLLQVSLIFALVGLSGAKRKCTRLQDQKYAYTPCDPRTNTTSIHFFYDDPECAAVARPETSESSEALSPYRAGLDCHAMCEADGHYTKIQYAPELAQVCEKCPPHSVAVNGGILLDAKMDDEEDVKKMLKNKFSITCQHYVVNGMMAVATGPLGHVQKCPSWSTTSQSLKTPQPADLAGEVTAGGLRPEVQVYKLQFQDHFIREGAVEFHYRASTKTLPGGIQNGVFQFLVDGVDQQVVEAAYLAGLWQRISTVVPAGFHTLEWRYSRYTSLEERIMVEDLAAEIEYIKIKGVSYTPRECTKCKKGIANENRTLCEPCPINKYYDEATSDCLPCPRDTYAKMDAHGRYSCVRRAPCVEADYFAEYGECDKVTQLRHKSYLWKEPMTCYPQHPQSVSLPAAESVKCRGCGRGEHRNLDTNQCEYCQPGFAQGHNNHMGAFGIIRQCQECPAGEYAKKVLEFREFEEMPEELYAICAETNDWGRPENCNLIQGFHVNQNGELDSGVGIPHGQKLQLKTVLRIDDLQGGKLSLTYKLLNLNLNEKFRISVDGLTLLLDSDSSSGTYKTFNHSMQGNAQHVVDIALLSDFQEGQADFTSKAQVLIQSALVEGSQLGGGVECLACPEGYISNEDGSGCEPCPPGKTPAADQASCIACPSDQYKQHEEGECLPCPEFTQSTDDGTKCLPKDVIVMKSLVMFHLHRLLGFDLYCSHVDDNLHNCDDEGRNAVGPVKSVTEAPYTKQSVFYFTTAQPLDIDRFEYHISKKSKVADHSFILMLKLLKHVTMEEIEDYLDGDIHSKQVGLREIAQQEMLELQAAMDNPDNLMLGQGLEQFVRESFEEHKDEFEDKVFIDEFRVQVSLGSVISSIGDLKTTGLRVVFGDGDICDKVTGRLFSSEIDFQCLPESEAEKAGDEKERPIFLDTEDGGCHYKFKWRTKYACSQCKTSQVDTIVGQCKQMNEGDLLNPKGVRTTVRTVKAGESCYIFDDPEENIDGSQIERYIIPTSKNNVDDMASYVTSAAVTEECTVLEGVIDHSAKLVGSESTAKSLWALFLFLLFLLLVCCCHTFDQYFTLSFKFDALRATVEQQHREYNLPDDYDYDTDAVYQSELEKEEARRDSLSFAERQLEDGIVDNSQGVRTTTSRKSNRSRGADERQEEDDDQIEIM